MAEFAETEALMVRLINLLADAFPSQAILRGGMVLRLLNCPRHTNDIDYVFVPYASKNDIAGPVLEALHKCKDFAVEHSMHSTCMRIIVSSGDMRVQIELNAALECRSQELSTAELARSHHLQGRIIRVMNLDSALSHKLAAWQERGLLRDLYDAYFLHEIIGVRPEPTVLKDRLGRLSYQRGKTKGPRSIKSGEFAAILRVAAGHLTENSIRKELSALLDEVELPGLELKMRKAMMSLAAIINEIP